MRYWRSETRLSWPQLHAMAKRLSASVAIIAGTDRQLDVFAPLPPPLHTLHQRVKTALDPGALFNPGRLYKEPTLNNHPN